MITMPKRARQPRPSDFEIADRLHSAAIHLLRRLRSEDAESGLSAPRMSALSVIVFAGPVSIGELAAAEQVRAPTMTRLVRDLERARLVQRVSSPDDGRVQIVRPTARGRRLLIEGRRRRVARLAEALSQLPRQDRKHLAHASRLLEILARPASRSGDETAPAPRR
jgi:DNA-binding MarR family transcriptional regulator